MEDLKERIEPYLVDRDPGDEDVRDRLTQPFAELHVTPGGAQQIRWPDGRTTGYFYIDEDGHARPL